MILKMGILVKFFVIGSCLGSVLCGILDLRNNPATEFNFMEIKDKIEIPQDEIDNAMDMDVGRYTTQNYHYFNNQFIKGFDRTIPRNESCIEEFMRCQVSKTVSTSVCAFNNHWSRTYGYYSTMSSCDIYFENCRRGYRVWRIIDLGVCRFWYNDYRDKVHKTFRRNNLPLTDKQLRTLGFAAGNSEASKYILSPSSIRADDKKERDVEQPVLLYSRKGEHPLVFDILKILATQSGNTEISISKNNASSLWPEQLKRRLEEEKENIDSSDFNNTSKRYVNMLKIGSSSGNTDVYSSKIGSNDLWQNPSVESWKKRDKVLRNDINKAGLPYTRRINQRTAVDILKALATQTGKPEITIFKL